MEAKREDNVLLFMHLSEGYIRLKARQHYYFGGSVRHLYHVVQMTTPATSRWRHGR